ncbi:MAG TPA: gamma-glutamylcyclotransferase family protein [Beijerinckiaceae bacterium]|jgi:gamma-glutamylcyclotransferase (GGCT)/AIG2-like uncharacterized protein YtfP
MPLVFAYGSNMDQAAMARRCPASRPLGPARLPRHRFVITTAGYASVERDPRRTAWGLLWDIAVADMPALDRYESTGTGLYRKAVVSVIASGGPRRAVAYLARDSAPGTPRPGYLEGVLAAGQEIGLPAAYLTELAGWQHEAGPRRAAPAPDGPVPGVRATRASPLAAQARAKAWRWDP